MLIFISDVQPEKAYDPIVVTVLGMLSSVSDAQPEKALEPIVVTVLGMLISLSDLQSEKGYDPIVVTVLGIAIDVSDVPQKKVLAGISVIFSETITFLNKDKASVVEKHALLIVVVSLLFD
jgi:hypothetical protein